MICLTSVSQKTFRRRILWSTRYCSLVNMSRRSALTSLPSEVGKSLIHDVTKTGSSPSMGCRDSTSQFSRWSIQAEEKRSTVSAQRPSVCSVTLLGAINERWSDAELTSCQIRKCLINNIKPKGLVKNSVI